MMMLINRVKKQVQLKQGNSENQTRSRKKRKSSNYEEKMIQPNLDHSSL